MVNCYKCFCTIMLRPTLETIGGGRKWLMQEMGTSAAGMGWGWVEAVQERGWEGCKLFNVLPVSLCAVNAGACLALVTDSDLWFTTYYLEWLTDSATCWHSCQTCWCLLPTSQYDLHCKNCSRSNCWDWFLNFVSSEHSWALLRTIRRCPSSSKYIRVVFLKGW